MADGGGIDVSIYKNAESANPFEFQNQLLDYRNKLLSSMQSEQQVQENAIKLATQRFGMMNNAAAGLLSDPDLGKKDITSKLWDVLGRLTNGDAMSAQHAVQFMQQFPDASRPDGLVRQVQAIKNVHAQTLDAWQRGQAYLGQTQVIGTGGGNKLLGVPAFGSGPVQDRGFVPNTLPPATPQYGANNQQTYTGGSGNAPLELPGAPRAQSGYRPPGSIVSAPAPGEIDLAAAPAKRADQLQATASTSQQYHADLENLRQDSAVMGNLGGPTQEVEKKLNQLSTRIAGFGVTMTPEQLRASESFDKIANQIALNQGKMLGGTDATRSMSVGATPNSGMSRYGRDGVIDMLQGNQDAVDRARKLWLQARANGAPASSHDLFMDRLGDELDPRVFQFNRLSRDNQQKFLSQMDPSDLKEFERKYRAAIEKKWVKPLKAANGQ